jgi:hypothetical protein
MRRSVGRVVALAATALATSAVVVAGVMTQASATPARPVAGAPRAPAASVPWRQIGSGWALAEYSASSGGGGGAGQPVKVGPLTLYLVSPAGAAYKLFTWSTSSPEQRWTLQAWSGDSKRALFTAPGTRQHVYQLNLQTGKLTSFTLPAHVTVLGYTRPSGLNIVAERAAVTAGSKQALLRYNLAGVLQKRLATGQFVGGIAYQASGTKLAVGYVHGLKLISNAGGVVRSLDVRGVNGGCTAVRWWTTSEILASCARSSTSTVQLWLVPANGKPTDFFTVFLPKNPAAGGHVTNAWQLSSSLYVDGNIGCGGSQILRHSFDWTEHVVSVPGATYSSVVTATTSQLMVDRFTSNCSPTPTSSLVWFNPVTNAVQVAIPDVHDQFGVIATVPYFVTGKV